MIAPLAAILMVALLGMTAFAVDTAMMYSEHAQLQNGADSSALAIAKACADNASSTDCLAPKDAATALAGDNALDGVSNVPVASVNLSSGTVDVTTQARDTANNNHFSLVFARVLGIDTADIGASSQAVFGGYSAADVIPLAFSQCEAGPSTVGVLQFFPEHGLAPGYKCAHKSSSGSEVPGGFGWLKNDTSQCTVHVDVTHPWVLQSEGGNFDSTCLSTFADYEKQIKAGKAVEILIPIFDTACPIKKYTGINVCAASTYPATAKVFRIEAFSQIELKGWHFIGGGGDYMPPDATALKNSLGLGNSDTGIYGKFIKKVTLAEAATLKGPTTYGAIGVALSK
ncbi:pilus assembly protein TadG-related protein [Pseudarthrobacter sp. S3]|uniref:pilus assembly protein TadG-related protein n=1 Tax=Pseudarthrobacter sp. S3 TaxID=3418419 RepID=UPI003CEA153A